MEEHSIIQGQTLLEVTFALLLTIVTASVYVSCRIYAQRRNAVPLGRLKTNCPTSIHKEQKSPSVSAQCSPLGKHSLSIGDWLVPLIVWTAVIWILLAVLGIFLGDS